MQDGRAVPLLCLDRLHQGKELIPCSFDIPALVLYRCLELRDLPLCRSSFHGKVGPIDGQLPDSLAAFGYPSFRPFDVKEYPVHSLQVSFLLLLQPLDGLLGKPDGPLCLFEISDQFQVF